jgi:hypothetical protein
MQANEIENTLAKRFQVDRPPTLFARTASEALIAFACDSVAPEPFGDARLVL